jgi:hypothetical protein
MISDGRRVKGMETVQRHAAVSYAILPKRNSEAVEDESTNLRRALGVTLAVFAG